MDENFDKLDRALDKAPYALLWLAVVLVALSVASQTYMWTRRHHAGPERDSIVIAGSGENAPYGRGGFPEDGL